MLLKAVSFFVLLCMVLYSGTTTAQKKCIDNESYKDWESLLEISSETSSLISNDGRYFAYKYGSPQAGSVLVAGSVDGKYREEFKEVLRSSFTSDSRKMVLLLQGDTLNILELGTSTIEVIPNVESFDMPQEGNWLFYKLKDTSHTLVVCNFKRNRKEKYSNVTNYGFNKNGSMLLLSIGDGVVSIDLEIGNSKKIVSGAIVRNFIFDRSGDMMIFHAKNINGTEIRFYSKGMDSAKVLIQNESHGMIPEMQIASTPIRFSPNGKKIFFSIERNSQTPFCRSNEIASDLNIWSYKNKFLSVNSLTKNNIFSAVYDIESTKIVQLTDSTTFFIGYLNNGDRNNFVLTQSRINNDEFYWNNETSSLYLVSTDGSIRRKIKDFIGENYRLPLLSPGEKFVIWFDDKYKHYFSYEISTGVIRNISEGLKEPIYDYQSDILERREQYGVAGWLKNDSALLIYDQYDIWQVDPTKHLAPINVTKGYGRTSNIVFRRVEREGEEFREITKDTILLSGLNLETKDNGFWKLKLGKESILDKCSMGPYVYYFRSSSRNILISSEDLPQKSRDANVYIVRRMSSSESPNLYVSNDLKTFREVTSIHPEKKYNWLTTELVTWKLPDGMNAQGILYKPENFDSTRKYPIIFHYYEKRSDGLNMFKSPELSNGVLNIPWYVSNGYLVFDPDIHYKIGHPGKSTVTSIEAAVKKLSHFSWVDTNKIGLQGHSFGGYETIFLITHSTRFAAAQESAGPSNPISFYSYTTDGIANRNHAYDIEQGNLGAPPWQRPDIYFENSPIFHVTNITTPLMILHNKGDDNVPFTQAIELFSALRRLKRPVWLLEYANEGHIIWNKEKNRLDFTIRQQQFFNHYLKGDPMPKWMACPGEKGFDLDDVVDKR